MDSAECSVENWLGFFMGAGIPSRVAADYAVTFSDNRMRPDMLPDLSKDYLRDMNITIMGDVIAILKHAKAVSQQEYTARKIGGGGGALTGAAAVRSRPAAAAPAPAPRAAVRPIRSDLPQPAAAGTAAGRPARSEAAPRTPEHAAVVRTTQRVKLTSDAAEEDPRWAAAPAPKRRIVPPGPDAPDVDDDMWPSPPAPKRRIMPQASETSDVYESESAPARLAVVERVRSRPAQPEVRSGQPAARPAQLEVRSGQMEERGQVRTAAACTRFSITGLGNDTSSQVYQRRPLGREEAAPPAAAPRQRITFAAERSPSPQRQVISTRFNTAVAERRRRVVPPGDSPVRSRVGAPSAAAVVRPEEGGFRSAAREVRPAPARDRLRPPPGSPILRPGPEEYQRSTGSRLKPPPVAVGPSRDRLKPPPAAVGPSRDRLRPPPAAVAPVRDRLKPPPAAVAPVRDRLKPPPAAVAAGRDRLRPPPAAQGMRNRLGAARLTVTTGAGKVIRLKGASVYSRLGDAGR